MIKKIDLYHEEKTIKIAFMRIINVVVIKLGMLKIR